MEMEGEKPSVLERLRELIDELNAICDEMTADTWEARREQLRARLENLWDIGSDIKEAVEILG